MKFLQDSKDIPIQHDTTENIIPIIKESLHKGIIMIDKILIKQLLAPLVDIIINHIKIQLLCLLNEGVLPAAASKAVSVSLHNQDVSSSNYFLFNILLMLLVILLLILLMIFLIML